jgi:hypothetical protein
MAEDDPFAPECEADAGGIMQCLQMLAEEAASLRLSRTLAALREAIDVCAAENVFDAQEGGTEECSFPPTRKPLTLH